MQSRNVLERAPATTFSEKFEAKRSAFLNLGGASSDWSNKKKSLSRFFEYDRLVADLYGKLRVDASRNLDDDIGRDAIRHFERISEFNNALDSLDTSTPRDIQKVFANFDKRMTSLGLTGGFIQTLSTGATIQTSHNVLDQEIENIHSVINRINTSEISPSEVKHIQDLINSLEAERGQIQETKDRIEQQMSILAETQLKIANAAGEIENARNEVIQNHEKYEKAAETAENWLAAEGRGLGASIGEKSELFNNKASNHQLSNIWWWLCIAGVLGVATAIAAGFLIFTLQGDHQISLGAAVLRFGLIAILSSGAYIAYRQYYIHRRLHESYKFKAIALSVMDELVRSYSDPSDRASILNQAIAIIFTEPTIKEDKAAQQRIVDELIDVLKSRIAK